MTGLQSGLPADLDEQEPVEKQVDLGVGDGPFAPPPDSADPPWLRLGLQVSIVWLTSAGDSLR